MIDRSGNAPPPQDPWLCFIDTVVEIACICPQEGKILGTFNPHHGAAG